MRKPHRLILALPLALALLAPACLFDTRENEVQPPSQSGCSVDLTAPQGVFSAITETFRPPFQDACYERALSDRFIFSPAPQDSLDQNFIGTGVYDNWNKQRELSALGLMLGDAQYLHWDFTTNIQINQTTFVRFRVDYDLQVVNTVAPADTNHYKGAATFDVRKESGGIWRITYWDEIEGVQGFSSWGYLRGVLGLRLGT